MRQGTEGPEQEGLRHTENPMGYTHTWSHDRFTPDEWCKIRRDCQMAVMMSRVPVGSGDARPGSSPEFADNVLAFNGIGADGHETFELGVMPAPVDFCKTARKPYDEVVVACLTIAAHHAPHFAWRSDGEREDLGAGKRLAARVLEVEA